MFEPGNDPYHAQPLSRSVDAYALLGYIIKVCSIPVLVLLEVCSIPALVFIQVSSNPVLVIIKPFSVPVLVLTKVSLIPGDGVSSEDPLGSFRPLSCL